MELGMTVFSQTVTLLVLMVVGIICYKAKIINETGSKQLTSLVMYVVNPLVIIMSYQTELSDHLAHGMITAFICSGISFAVAIAVSYIFIKKSDKYDFMVERLSVVYSNCGFVGIPLISGIFGAEGVLYLTAYLTFYNVLIWSHGIVSIRGNYGGGSFKKIITNPSILAVIVGFLFMLFEIKIPFIPGNAFELIVNVNSPLAMIVAGATIATTSIKSAFKKLRIYYVSALRLMAVPLLTLLCTVPFFGSDVPVLTVAILAGCPVGAMITLFAVKFDKDSKYTSEIFAFTTLISCASLPLLVSFLP